MAQQQIQCFKSHSRHLPLILPLIIFSLLFSSWMSSESLPPPLRVNSVLRAEVLLHSVVLLWQTIISETPGQRELHFTTISPNLKSVHTAYHKLRCTNTDTKSHWHTHISFSIFSVFIYHIFTLLKLFDLALKFILHTPLQSLSRASGKTSQSAKQQMTASIINHPVTSKHMHRLSLCLPPLTSLQNLFIDRPHLEDLGDFLNAVGKGHDIQKWHSLWGNGLDAWSLNKVSSIGSISELLNVRESGRFSAYTKGSRGSWRGFTTCDNSPGGQ